MACDHTQASNLDYYMPVHMRRAPTGTWTPTFVISKSIDFKAHAHRRHVLVSLVPVGTNNSNSASFMYLLLAARASSAGASVVRLPTSLQAAGSWTNHFFNTFGFGARQLAYEPCQRLQGFPDARFYYNLAEAALLIPLIPRYIHRCCHMELLLGIRHPLYSLRPGAGSGFWEWVFKIFEGWIFLQLKVQIHNT